MTFSHVMPLAQQWHHMTPMALLLAPLQSLGQDNWNKVPYDFFGHVMPLKPVSPMAPLHSLGQNKWNEVQHDIFGCVTALLLASHEANGTIAFLRSRQSKWGATWLFDYLMPLASHDTNGFANGT